MSAIKINTQKKAKGDPLTAADWNSLITDLQRLSDALQSATLLNSPDFKSYNKTAGGTAITIKFPPVPKATTTPPGS